MLQNRTKTDVGENKLVPKSVEHFDCAALIAAVHEQPLGLAVSTNHPPGFRRLLYLHMRQRPHKKVRILQAPDSPNKFYLVKEKPNAG